MRTDSKIKEDVLEELAWQPNIDETQIGVVVDKGIVTLSGTVDSYSKKITAEKAAKSVFGVRAVAEDIKVQYGTSYQKTDSEIARASADALKWNTSVPEDKINIKVEDGWVYLSGAVMWDYQKQAAKKTVEKLAGVKFVSNTISIEQPVKPIDIKNRITKAFKRSADIDAKNVTVAVDGHTVKLRGKVHSLAEKEDARKAAYFAPGVYKVENELEIVY